MNHLNHDSEKCNQGLLKRVITGFMFLAVGAVFTMYYMDILDPAIEKIIFTWQMLLIAIGVVTLTGKHGIVPGVILITVGSIYLIPKLGFVDYPVHHLWIPAIFIIIGLFILFKTRSPRRDFKDNFHKNNLGTDYIDETNVFGGGTTVVTSKTFRGGKIVCVFGGSKIDFSEAALAEGTNYLEIVNVFGGTEMLIPREWKVKTDVTAILGGFEDRKYRNITTIEMDETKVLVIKGVVIFGGGDIKRV
ncbi:MAG: hypothetical protein A2W91_01455 [Bacteroidetes bacterium GWF2_38_335]|nr:MAG: hypothetical protein A2W91_01455 [Bacteroidetes bacterium GWF2_38_335]OFY78742.1 MAG: hypothetical protein A2281_19030 [Bacteroidetes bacterium RIFOXYA12_FULL_38_20]HBS85129.1 hypothetical protein [Bacteroidales bacterium]